MLFKSIFCLSEGDQNEMMGKMWDPEDVNSLQESKESIFRGQRNMKQFIEFVSGTQARAILSLLSVLSQYPP